ADALVSARRPHADAGSNSRNERRASRSAARKISAARTSGAFAVQGQTTTPARHITPEKLPVSLSSNPAAKGCPCDPAICRLYLRQVAIDRKEVIMSITIVEEVA